MLLEGLPGSQGTARLWPPCLALGAATLDTMTQKVSCLGMPPLKNACECCMLSYGRRERGIISARQDLHSGRYGRTVPWSEKRLDL